MSTTRVSVQEPEAVQQIWKPTYKQHIFITCPIEDVLFGGARGGGKSDGLLGDWMCHARMYGTHARGLFIRQTYPELEEIEARCHDIFGAMGWRWRGSSRTWISTNGARLRLRYLEREEDAGRYQGWSNSWVCFDELQKYKTLAGVDKIRATLRSPYGIPTFNRCTANPGDVGHSHVKMRYVDPAPPMTPFLHIENRAGETVTVERCYIPSTLDDNPYLTKNDPNYWQRVSAAASGNEDLLRAWRFGDWNISAGGMFTEIWNDATHFISPFPIPSNWHVSRGFDWGSAKPFCTLWYAVCNGESLPDGRSYPPGTIFIIHEDYGWNEKPNEGLHLPPRDIAKRVNLEEQKMLDMGLIAKKPMPGPADDPMFDTTRGRSMAQEHAEEGVHWTKPSKGKGSRIAGWQNIRQRLMAAAKHPMEEPGLFVFTSAIHLRRTLPVLPKSKLNPDDVDTESEDHAADALRYILISHRGPAILGRIRS